MFIIHHFLGNRTKLPIYLGCVSWTFKYHVFLKILPLALTTRNEFQFESGLLCTK